MTQTFHELRTLWIRARAGTHVYVVDLKVTEVRGNFVEDEYYQMATEFQETSLRPDISVACT